MHHIYAFSTMALKLLALDYIRSSTFGASMNRPTLPFLSTIILIAIFAAPLVASATSANVKRANDINPDPHIFETTITAAPKRFRLASGEFVTVFAYNGLVPGPEIRVKQGDRLIVHFENALPDGYTSTIHWHGIELNNSSDGTPMTQDPVKPGEAFTYDFIVPRSGVFWYHPHIRGSQVVNAGLYGSLIVEERAERELIKNNILPRRDRTIVLSDMSVVDGELKDIESAPMLETMNGTEGNHILVNGRELPTFKVRSGEPLRLRLINASISRYFRLSLPGHTIFRVGGEGGLLSRVRVEGGPLAGMRMPMPGHDGHDYAGYVGPIAIDQGYDYGELLLAPAQRADIVIIPQGHAGGRLTVEWKDFARGRHQMVMTPNGMMMTEADDDGLRPAESLFHLKLHKPRKHRGHSMHAPYTISAGDPLREPVPRLVPDRQDTQIKLQANMMAMMQGMPKQTWFAIDDYSGVDGRTNYRTAQTGEVLKWETHNHTDMHHPFHLHGFSFQPVVYMTMHHDHGFMDMWSVNNENEFVDTVNVPPHTSVFYLFEVTERPEFAAEVGSADGGGAIGDWVFHCHIFQHGENGMMSFLRIAE
jgi:FtsP/CotA-like multicopper oxidase with cupredoxin domain